ncbi:MAG: SusC/RagA family TonB-linked outer membrane protein [Saprospiraceae bacterium]|nr:SusC/RagA family TonB-linked outer membrane protein [Saprospiraceae bacterium]
MKYNFLRKSLMLFALLVVGAQAALAQFTATGRVTDASGQGIAGATIAVVGGGGAATDVDGNYRVKVDGATATLVVSYVGYKSVTVQVSSSAATADVTLEEDFAGLDEVIVSGLATNVKRSNLANAVSSISSNDLVGTTVQSSMDAALYGKLTGVNIISNSGAPGGGTTVKLRGITTLNGSSQPLYIVDGVYYDNSAFTSNTNFISKAAGQGSTLVQDNPSNRVADLDPEDIERIEVLKGASAAAMYGSRAGAGVVIITTKRGRRDGTSQVNFSQSIGFQQQLKKLGVREWDEAKVEAGFGASEVPVFQAAKNAGKLYNYEDELYGNKGLLSTTRLSLNGGSDKVGYFAGFTRKTEEGIIKNTGYEKTSARLNLDLKPYSWADLQIGMNYVTSNADRGFFNNDNTSTTMGISFVSTPSWANLFPDDNGNYPNNPYAPSNFLQTRDLITNSEKVDRILGGGIGNFQIWNNERNSLKLIVRGGLDQYTLETQSIFPRDLQFQKDGNGTNGASINSVATSRGTNIAAFFVHTLNVGDNNTTFRTQAGVTQENLDQNYTNTVATQLIGSQTNVDQAGSIQSAQTKLIQRDKGFFAQEEFNYQEKLIATVGIRGDKSSRNGDPNKLYYYPKASLALNIHKFTDLGTTLSQLKLRGAFGQSGNFGPFGATYTPLNPIIIDGSTGSLIGTTAGNEDIGPERQTEIEVGADLGLFKDRLTIEATYYIKKIDDLILQVNRPSSSGFTAGWQNAADLENKGVEIALDATPVASKRFQWNTRLSMWFNRAKITRLDVPAFNVGAFGATLGTYRIDTLASPTQLVGIGPSDQTGDKSDQFFVYGDAEPDFQLSFNNGLSFGNFEFNALLHWKAGGENVNLSTLLSDIFGTSPDYDDTTTDPSGSLSNGAYRLSQLGVSAQAWVEDASYVRLREVGLRYNLPSSMFNDRAKIRIGVSARNPLNFFKYNSYDPEVSNFGTNAISSNVEVTPFPSAKSYFVTLSATF